MPLVTLKEILDAANQGGYAVPAFDAVDHASAEGIVAAAEQKKRAVIIMVPEVAFALIDTDSYFQFLVALAQRAAVPVALELDHGQSFSAIMKAIHGGFSAVMFDGSSLPYEENVAQTKKIVEIAHAAGVSVEAEIGHVGGGEGSFDGSEVDTTAYTKPMDAKRFAEETGVDALAVAFGTVHGVYKGVPKLDFERVKEIKNLVSVPLVMHGGSGVSEGDFVKAVESGINKINLFTEISLAAVAQSVSYSQQKQNKLHFAELVLVAKKTVTALSAKYIDLFSLNKN